VILNFIIFNINKWCIDEDWLNHLAISDGMTIDQFVNYDIRLFWLSPLNFYYPDPAYAESQRSVPIWLMKSSFLKRELDFNINEMPLYNDIVAVRELETGKFRIIPYSGNSDCLSKQSKQKLLNFLFLNLIYPSNMFVYFIFIIFKHISSIFFFKKYSTAFTS